GVGAPGAHPAALHLPTGRYRGHAADARAQRARQRGRRRRRALHTGRRRPARQRSRRRRGPPGGGRRHRVHGHRPVHATTPRRPTPLDGPPASAGGSPSRKRGLRPARPARRVPAVTGVVLAVASAYGAYLLYTAIVLGWSGLGAG